jgi:hypothetical protein
METFILHAKIARFKAMLLAEDNFFRQQMLLELLAAEEAKLVALEKIRNVASPKRSVQDGPLAMC